MKLQHIAILFIIIIVPISLVMASYIQNQIDAISMQTDYDRMLISATYDAVKAFQLNTINNKYSSVSDSKIRDIEASVNTFYNTMMSSMLEYALSVKNLQAYIPAMLFTLYDGYYIYSSYDNVYSLIGSGEDEKVNIKLDGNNYENGLKPYVYYSAKYKLNNGNIIVVNYTLDNEITVYGDLGEGYVTKSGYLINPDFVQNVNEGAKTLTYDGVTIKPEELKEHLITIEDQETGRTAQGDYHYIFYQNKKIYEDGDGSGKYFWYDNYIKTEINDPDIISYVNSTKKYSSSGNIIMSTSAFDYYNEAKEFSQWVRDNLGNITQANMLKVEDGVTSIGGDNSYLAEDTGSSKIFYADEKNDPMLAESAFNNHRLAVIRKTIETSLNTVISNYHSTTLYDYAMPVIGDDDWYKILNNISLVTFMQGTNIGYRYYNNYAVITNNINKEVVKPENIYVIAEKNGVREYHQPGCKELIDGVKNGEMTIIGAYPVASFQRQTVEINEVTNEYFYPQARDRKTLTGCYNCIVDATGDYDINDIIDGTIEDYTNEQNILYNKNDIAEIRQIYLNALARERYDLYKSNFDLSNLG